MSECGAIVAHGKPANPGPVRSIDVWTAIGPVVEPGFVEASIRPDAEDLRVPVRAVDGDRRADVYAAYDQGWRGSITPDSHHFVLGTTGSVCIIGLATVSVGLVRL